MSCFVYLFLPLRIVGLLRLLTIMNTVMLCDMHIPLEDPAFSSLGLWPEVGTLDSMVVLFLTFSALPPSRTVLLHFTAPPTMHRESSLFTLLLPLAMFWRFLVSGRPNGCEVIAHAGFDLCFPSD